MRNSTTMSTSAASPQPDPVPYLVQRLVAASGIAFAILFVVVIALAGDETPDDSDPITQWTEFARDNESNIRLSVLVFGLAAYQFFLFLGWVRQVFGDAELRARGFTRAGYIILSAGTAGIIGLGVGIGTTGGALANPDTPPEILKALNDLGSGGWVMAAAGFSAMFVTIGLVNANVRAVPAWLGWVALGAGVAFLLQLGVLLDDEEDNFFGIFYPIAFLLLIIFCVGASVQFLRSLRSPVAAAGAHSPPPPA